MDFAVSNDVLLLGVSVIGSREAYFYSFDFYQDSEILQKIYYKDKHSPFVFFGLGIVPE